MADDDYLSDKFLSITEPQKPITYSEKRKEALRKSLLKNERNRTKSTRHLELESRAEGLSRSLFERAEDDIASGSGTENKALSMMKKMGFKPGQVLGVPANLDVDERPVPIPTTPPRRNPSPSPETLDIQSQTHEGRLVNPLPLNVWSGTSSLLHAFLWTFSDPPLVPPFLARTDSTRRAKFYQQGRKALALESARRRRRSSSARPRSPRPLKRQTRSRSGIGPAANSSNAVRRADWALRSKPVRPWTSAQAKRYGQKN